MIMAQKCEVGNAYGRLGAYEKQKAKAIRQAKKLLQREGLLPPDEPLASWLHLQYLQHFKKLPTQDSLLKCASFWLPSTFFHTIPDYIISSGIELFRSNGLLSFLCQSPVPICGKICLPANYSPSLPDSLNVIYHLWC